LLAYGLSTASFSIVGIVATSMSDRPRFTAPDRQRIAAETAKGRCRPTAPSLLEALRRRLA